MSQLFSITAMAHYYNRDPDAVRQHASRADTLLDAITAAAASKNPGIEWLQQAIRDHLAGRPITKEPTI